MEKGKWILGVLLAYGLAHGSAGAMTYGFENITLNGQPNVADQLTVSVTDAGNGQVSFQFFNDGPYDATITEIYFDDGTLLGIASIVNGSGVSFDTGDQNGVNPGDLPGGENLLPAFEARDIFSTEASGNTSAGMDTGETLTILFELLADQEYADTIAAIEDGSLRIGLHVRSIGPDGISDSFVNLGTLPVPDAASSIILMGLALLGIEGIRRKSRN